jgi:hypothetical protein
LHKEDAAESDQRSDDALLEFLKSAGAGGMAHRGGSTLYGHLFGVREILRTWAQPVWMQEAGAIHSIYSTGAYRQQLVPLSERDRIRELAGERSERLAWLFCFVSRSDLWGKLDLCGVVPAEGLTLQVRDGGDTTVTVCREEIFSLLVLCMADEAEQAQGHEGCPGLWLARVSGWGRRLREGPGPYPPVMDSCQQSIELAAERRAREFWLLGLDSICTDVDTAESQFVAASQCCRWIAEPLIGAAYIANWRGDIATTQQLAREAAGILRQWGTAWDKRVSFANWLGAAETLARGEWEPAALSAGFRIAGRNLSAAPPSTERISFPAIAGIPGPTGGAASDDRRLEAYLSLLATNHRHPRMSLYPGLSSKPWYDAADFVTAKALEANFKQIRDEAADLGRAAFQRETEPIPRDGNWDVFFLYERGLKMEENCARCPVTTRIVEEQPAIRALCGLIYFSRMSPGTHVQPHRGITNMRVRCHLGLQIPAGECGLRVGKETRRWQEGRSIVFDDFYEHEVWNRTAEDRIVLIVDLWHPDLTPREIAIVGGMQRYAFQHARDLSRYWSRNEGERAAARKEFA